MSALAGKRRGGPLVMLGIVLTAWVAGRTVLWVNPYDSAEALLDSAGSLLAEAPVPPKVSQSENARTASPGAMRLGAALAADVAHSEAVLTEGPGTQGSTAMLSSAQPGIRARHQLLWLAALARNPGRTPSQDGSHRAHPNGFSVSFASDSHAVHGGSQVTGGPDAMTAAEPGSRSPQRWSLDAWAFWREGSNGASVSQGRVPIYGASQIGSVLQYRFDRGVRRDPRAYIRAYRALIDNGESELAVGVSARPVEALPLRIHAEIRGTNRLSGEELRGAAFVTTEILPVELPLETRAELYGQGGYVGGDAATAFADGQVQITRDVVDFDLGKSNNAKFAVGAGAWAGVQDDVYRVDLGPTMRVDLSIGTTPARLSVDWRERVAGEAAPSSGVAATLSTRF